MTGQMEAITVGTCEFGQFKDAVLTKQLLVEPKVPKSLEFCTFYLCARVAEPFVNANCTTGLEISIINILREAFNFQVSAYTVYVSQVVYRYIF